MQSGELRVARVVTPSRPSRAEYRSPGSLGLGACQIARRVFIAIVAGSAIAWPSGVIAQSPGRVWRIGVLGNEPWPPLDGLRLGLRELGYIDGQNLRLEYRFATGHADRYSALAAELVGI